MEDNQIVDLYWQRSEQAISETDKKYGKLCKHIAFTVLNNHEDTEEIVSDTYMTAWNHIPPSRPPCLSGFLAKITRNLSINRWHAQRTEKRGGGQVAVALDELKYIADDQASIEKLCESKEAIRSYNTFLGTLPQAERNCFLRRYYFLESIEEIANATGFTYNKVASMLFRTRKKFKKHLHKEGYI